MPLNNREIVIDKMVYDRTNEIEMIGLYELNRMLDVSLYVGDKLLEYKIVGIVDMNSPSIYVDNSEFINIISNSGNNYEEDMDNTNLYDYSLYKDKLKEIVLESLQNVTYSHALLDIPTYTTYPDKMKDKPFKKFKNEGGLHNVR